MNNKKLGTAFERRVVDYLSSQGYWAHFIVPDARGAQPFDIIAVKDGKPLAIDCKTCSTNVISYSRLEENQKTAFEYWMRCGNSEPWIAAEYKEQIIWIRYLELKERKTIKLNEKV